MSSAYDHDSTHGENPNCTIPPQNQEEDDPPFSLHLFPSPFLDDNQLFLNHMICPYYQNHQQQLMLADDDQINHETDSRYTVINKHNISTINTTTEEISTLTTRTTAATHHVPTSSSSEVAQKGKPSTNNDTNNNKKAPSTQRKRGKKDRHSKICTAQGLRDRRMRLSLQIARKFFDLQDTLGFDKASKTIDWLFSKSKKAVKKLSCNANHLAQMSNNIVPNNSVYSQVKSDEMIMRKALTTTSDSVSGKRKTGCKYNHGNAKEMREKARARARERTREKMMMRSLENAKQINYLLNHHQTSTCAGYNQLGYGGNPNFEAGEKEELMSMSSCPSKDQNIVEAFHYKDLNSHSSSLHHQLASVGILDNFFGSSTTTSSAASCSIFDYPRNDDALLFSGKNPTSVFTEDSCYHHFQTENQDN